MNEIMKNAKMAIIDKKGMSYTFIIINQKF